MVATKDAPTQVEVKKEATVETKTNVCSYHFT